MYTWGALNYYFHIDGQQFFFLFFNFTSFDILLSYNISISQDYFFFPPPTTKSRCWKFINDQYWWLVVCVMLSSSPSAGIQDTQRILFFFVDLIKIITSTTKTNMKWLMECFLLCSPLHLVNSFAKWLLSLRYKFGALMSWKDPPSDFRAAAI